MKAAPALVVLLPVVLAAASSCDAAGGRERLTVVVEADRARARADQERLQRMQESLASAQRELEATRADLTLLREKLLQAGALSADEAARLEAREKRLAAQARDAQASSSGAASPSSGGSGTSVDDVGAVLASVRELRVKRGLRPDDVEGGGELEQRVDAALREKKTGAALELAKALADRTAKTAIDGDFVQRKYARAAARLGVLDADKQKTAKALLGEATSKHGSGDMAAANAALNRVLDLR
jgi:hypothetical protein